MTDRKKPGVAFWATVAIAGLVLYVASFGPACWMVDNLGIGYATIPVLYRPVIRCSANGPPPVAALIDWWAHLYCVRDWWFESDHNGELRWVAAIRILEPSGSMSAPDF